jgi:hypothetical protein
LKKEKDGWQKEKKGLKKEKDGWQKEKKGLNKKLKKKDQEIQE